MVFVLQHIPEGVNYIIAYQHYSIASYMYVMHEWIKGLSATLTFFSSIEMESFENQLSTHGRLTSLRNNPQQKQLGGSKGKSVLYLYKEQLL